MATEELGPLPAGRHGISREQVEHSQRERLIAGLASAVAERGYNAVTIADITSQARVSRRVFYANFAGKEECFLAAFEVVVGYVRELAAEAVAATGGDWPERAVAAARAALAFFAAEPALARLCLVESNSAGPAVATRFRDSAGELTPLLRQGRTMRDGQRPLPDSTEDSIVGALLSLAGRKVAAGEAERLGDLLPDVTEFVLAPYLGAEAAAALAREAA